jgi:uncharacterized membrane protein YedE/YeeE
MKRDITVFLCGVLFALGLGISGMTQPTRIIGFLDVFGAWDPSMLFVMAGAVGVNVVLYRLTLKRPHPLFAPAFAAPPKDMVNKTLVAGAALFGVGWGLSGYCPGPALVSTVTGWGSVLAFVGAMLAGMYLFQRLHAGGRSAGMAHKQRIVTD